MSTLTMDVETRRHFEDWLAMRIPRDMHESVRTAMLLVFEEDADYYMREGWWRLYDVAWKPKH